MDSTDRVLAILEGQSDKWAQEVKLPEIIKGINGYPQKIDAMLRQAFEEGFYRGWCAAKDQMSVDTTGENHGPK